MMNKSLSTNGLCIATKLAVLKAIVVFTEYELTIGERAKDRLIELLCPLHDAARKWLDLMWLKHGVGVSNEADKACVLVDHDSSTTCETTDNRDVVGGCGCEID